MIVGVNTLGIFKGRNESLFPGEYILRQLGELKVQIILSSDAHQPDELSRWFEVSKAILKNCGINSVYSFSNEAWIEQTIV